MAKKVLALTLWWFCCFSPISHAYIEAALDLKIVGDRHLILLFDAYEGYSITLNQANAIAIAQAAKNLALKHPSKIIDFSYEDPAVYDVGKHLRKQLPLIAIQADNIAQNQFVSLLPPISGLPSFDMLALSRPPKLTTYLAGDLTKALSLVYKETAPRNLIIRSNDPRHEHYLALTNDQTWLLRHSKTIRMRNLITAAPLFKAKRAVFQMDTSLDGQAQQKLISLIKDFDNTEKQQLMAFANFASLPSGQNIDVSQLDRTIYQLRHQISLDKVHEFLLDTKNQIDIYQNGPVLDVLLTLFNKKHPDKMMVILGHHLTKKLVQILDELGVIREYQEIPNAVEYITKMAQKDLRS